MSKRFFMIYVMTCAVVLAAVLASCATSGKPEVVDVEKAWAEGKSLVKQFEDAGASIQVDKNFISLKKDLHLPAGITLVLNTGETWNINLNGHTIFKEKGDASPAIVVEHGTLTIVTGRPEKYQGGVYSSDGSCIRVRKGAVLDVQAGTISGGDYAIEVMEGGTLKVHDGRIQASVLPVRAQFGWAGNFMGGLFSRYDETYDQAILGDNFASVRIPESDHDFAARWPEGFRVVQGHRYQGLAQLKISSAGGYSAYFKLYREQDVDDVLRYEDPVAEYEWFMYPGQVMTREFVAGRYILKVAEGYEFTEEGAFGDKGIYWCLEPFDFEDGKVYVIDRKNGTADTKEGFLNP